MKAIHLDRTFAIAAVLGVLFALFVHGHAFAEEPIVGYGATTASGATIALLTEHGKCPDDTMTATYTGADGKTVSGCWKPINSKQALVVWDDGEVVAYFAANFHALKAS